MTDQSTIDRLDFGTKIFDSDGRKLGTIRGFDEDGFYVTFREGIEGMSTEHVRTTGSFGEAELMWRCWNCGELGKLSGDIPDGCPSCGADKEDLYYWTED